MYGHLNAQPNAFHPMKIMAAKENSIGFISLWPQNEIDLVFPISNSMLTTMFMSASVLISLVTDLI